jgi:hypothetical protein
MPAFRRFQLDPADPAGSALKKLRIHDWLKGRAAIAVRGVGVALDKGRRVGATPAKPAGLELFHEVLGAVVGAMMEGGRGDVAIRLDLDFAAVIEPGPELRRVVTAFLQEPPLDLKRRVVQMGGRQLLHIAFPPMPLERNVSYAPELYADLGEERWLFATDADLLAQMLAGGPRKPLLGSDRFRDVRSRLTGGHRAVFGWLDAARTLAMFRKFVPPIMAEAFEKHGLNSLVGAGFGVSLVEGGVRESFGIVLDGEPKGVWRLLDALPGGMRSIEIAPPETGALLGLKFDLRTLVRRIAEEGDALAPGLGARMRKELAEMFDGVTFVRDVLPAFGDEVGLLLFKPRAMMPEWVFGLDLSDEAAFRRLLPQVQDEIGDRWKQTEIEEGLPGWELEWTAPGPAPLFTIAKGHFFGASDKKLLLGVLHKWGTEGAMTLRKDNPSFVRTLRGLNGGEHSSLVALAFLDLRSTLPSILGLWPVGDRDWEDYLDFDEMPDPTRLFARMAGAAVGVRRDGHGIFLDTYSPVGVIWIPTLAVYWALDAWR